MFGAMNKGLYDDFLSYFDDDLVFVHSTGELNKGELAGFYQVIDTISRGHRHEIERTIVERNSVVVECTWSGTHTGAYQGIKPSHRSFEMPEVWILDFTEGKVAHALRLADNNVFTKLAD